jgi:hypothetical protein
MKVRVYLRVARTTARGTTKVMASTKPPREPLREPNGEALPTAYFGLDITLPDDMFRVPVVAEVEVPGERVHALVVAVDA